MTFDKFAIAAITPPSILIIRQKGDQKELLRINSDGTVIGEVENASEAGRVFVDAIRQNLSALFEPPMIDEAMIKKALYEYNGGLTKVPDESNARGYTTMYLPEESMRRALEIAQGKKADAD